MKDVINQTGFFKDQYQTFRKTITDKDLKCFASLKNDVDRWKFVRDKNKLEFPWKGKDTKNLIEAMKLKAEGNKSFQDGHYANALSYYTQSLLMYPSDGDRTEQSIIRANRSAALYHLKEYKAALSDIEVALNQGYPQHLRHKVLDRSTIRKMEEFVNILTKSEYSSDVLWVSRFIQFTKAYTASDKKASSHDKIKKDVIESDVMKALKELEKEAASDDQARLHAAVHMILSEIGYDRSLTTIRWLALITVKIIRKTLDGIYVNEASILKLKASMGHSPYILVPTHRSYGDFILMAFICFVYEIEIPCVAAGLDFLSMWMMGEILRKTKAFFIRRSFQDDKLYKMIFGQYVSSMVANGDSPIEFFIEGTRSRTGKSLKPKYGFLSMILKPFLDGVVPDIQLVPVSISYDRYLEEWLFARELLGTPKPKESTKGLLKIFSILKENYGNVYFNFGEPISTHELISRVTDEPIISRPLSVDVKRIAAIVIKSHSKLQVLGGFHLITALLYGHLVNNNQLGMPITLVASGLKLLCFSMRSLKVNVLLSKDELLDEINYICTINPELMVMRDDRLIFLGKNTKKNQVPSTSNELRGDETEETYDPTKVILLALYTNPVASVLFYPSLFLALIAARKYTSDIVDSFNFLCDLFEEEFPVGCCDKENSFEQSKSFLVEMGCIVLDQDEMKYNVSSNSPLLLIMYAIIQPYILGYYLISRYLMEVTNPSPRKTLLMGCKSYLLTNKEPSSILSPLYHSTTFVTFCLSAFTSVGCLTKEPRKGAQDLYLVNRDRMSSTASILGTLLSHSNTNCALRNKL